MGAMKGANVDTKIQLDDVVKIFGKNPKGPALEMVQQGATQSEVRKETGHVVGVGGVSLDINEGEVFVVMGLSGSGKSTLIRCINRILEPTSGTVVIDDENIVDVDLQRMREIRREKMSMVFQHFALFPHKTVLDNAAYGLKVQHVDEEERNRRATDALELVGLADWADRYPHNLSGGMQQRVGLARGLATDPDIMLMDEAFSALDPLIRRQMQNELLSLQEKVQKTIVFITHDLNEALRVGTRVMIMKEGRVVQIGTPTEIVTEPADQYVADFMADVDHAKVLPASFVMEDTATFGEDAPASTASAAAEARGYVYVVDDRGAPVGLAAREDFAGGGGTVGQVAKRDFPVASEFTRVAELFQLSGEGQPVAVTNRDGRLVGSVTPVDILRTLGEVEVVDYAPTTTEET